MTDLMISCWEQFVTIYILGKTLGLTSIKYFLSGIFIFGILRSIYRYAAGDSIGKLTHSAWILRFLDWLLVKIEWTNKTEFLDDNLEPIPVGFNLLGIPLDAGITGVFLGILLFIWPGMLLVIITFVPLQLCRDRNIRKKEFVAKLKGTVKGTEAR